MLRIDLNALSHNFNIIKKLAPNSKILGMVKGNAYGHGLIPVARCLAENNIHGFGVACLSEAIKLREAGLQQKIVVMRGVYNTEQLQLAKKLKLDCIVHHESQIALLIKNPSPELTLWVKINTGMNRLGFAPNTYNIEKICRELQSHHYSSFIFITHFASSEIQNDPMTRQQINLFNAVMSDISAEKTEQVEKSLCNSGGILNYPECHQDWVRPGLMLYGVSPVPDKFSEYYQLKPVMNFESVLLSVYTANKGDKIGYNSLYQCEENMPIGIVGVGYADGYSLQLKSGTPILVENTEAKVIGKVSMDMLAIDLRNHPAAKINDRVTLWGNALPIEKVAQFNQASPYELLCHVRER